MPIWWKPSESRVRYFRWAVLHVLAQWCNLVHGNEAESFSNYWIPLTLKLLTNNWNACAFFMNEFNYLLVQYLVRNSCNAQLLNFVPAVVPSKGTPLDCYYKYKNNGSIRVDPYWTSSENSLELIKYKKFNYCGLTKEMSRWMTRIGHLSSNDVRIWISPKEYGVFRMWNSRYRHVEVSMRSSLRSEWVERRKHLCWSQMADSNKERGSLIVHEQVTNRIA